MDLSLGSSGRLVAKCMRYRHEAAPPWSSESSSMSHSVWIRGSSEHACSI